MEQDRDLLLANDNYARSRYKESTSLSNKKVTQMLNLCEVKGNKEIPLVMGLTYEQAREYEIGLLYKQLKAVNERLNAVQYFLDVSNFAETLHNLKMRGNLSLDTREGERVYLAFQTFDVVYKYGKEVGYIGKTDELTAVQLYTQLEDYYAQLQNDFNKPVIDLQGAVWLGISNSGAKTVEIVLSTGEKILVPQNDDDYKSYFGTGVITLETLDKETVYINRSNIAYVRLQNK